MGSTKCRETPGMPLIKYAASPTADEKIICGGCKFYGTKIESAGERIFEFIESKKLRLDSDISISEIVGAIYRAMAINNLPERVQLVYPTSLSPLDWRYLQAFSAGKNSADVEKNGDE